MRLFRYLLTLSIIVAFALIGYFYFYTPKPPIIIDPDPKELEQLTDAYFSKQLAIKTKEALDFAKANNFDTENVVLIDFAIHSGKERFFVWSYAENKAILKSLVAHGYGKGEYESTNDKIFFSNIPNSYTSSLGKYRLGIRSPSQYGIKIHYKMHGLEQTNNKAYERYIVLHSYQDFPNEVIFPFHLPLGYSQGCPVIDDESMRKMDKLLQSKQKPVLLWIYYSELPKASNSPILR